MKDPRELPDTPIDFRLFAKELAKVDDLAGAVNDALDLEVRSRAIVFGGEKLPPPKRDPAIAAVLEAGYRAVAKAAVDPATGLTPAEDAGLEAIVRLRDRPALLVRKDSFIVPPERWAKLHDPFRQEISRGLPSSGRIDFKPGEMCGTGFVVAEDLVLTNRHVIKFFADPSPLDDGRWAIHASARPAIDFKQEHGEPGKRVFAVREVVGVHPVLDLALLRVSRQAMEPAGAPLPSPLTLASAEPDTADGLDLYAVGYPWLDSDGQTPPHVIEAIFEGILQVKRLQPGVFTSPWYEYAAFAHDCSTLGGNSGSCIVDLSLDRVIGIHFKGSYRQANYALALWMLKDDPLFAGRGLRYARAEAQ
jgi:hypothetical protein